MNMIDDETRSIIVKCFWGDGAQHLHPTNHEPYFRFYESKIRKLHLGLRPKDNLSATPANHLQICSIVELLSSREYSIRPEIRAAIRKSPAFTDVIDDATLNRAIDLALRLWLTMNIQARRSDQILETPTIEWNDQIGLAELVALQFPVRAARVPGDYQQTLQHDFTAVNIGRLSGVSIRWTTCLADHLNYDYRRRELKVYPYKNCLLAHLNRPAPAIIPVAVLEETLLSLDLLFPCWDPKTIRFLEQNNQNFFKYGPVKSPLPLDINDFSIWGDRLSRLHEVYNSHPVGWRQMWHDRRNPLQWYTFWLAAFIALMTFIFGVISSVTSVIQARAALRSSH